MTNIANRDPDSYDSVTKTIATATTDYNWKATGGGFTNAPKSSVVSVRTDAEISIKLGATTNGSITIAAADSPFEINNLVYVTNVFISNASGGNAVVQIFNA